MLDIKFIRKNRELIEEKIRTKEPHLSLDRLLQLDEETRALKTEVERLKAERHSLSATIGKHKRNNEPVEALMQSVHECGEKIGELDRQLLASEAEFNKEMAQLPNPPMDDVKVSLDKNENVSLKEVGEKPHFNFSPKNHVELNNQLKLFEFQGTAKTSGSGWVGYRGLGARLEWALLSYMIDVQVKNGFEFWLPPILVRPQVMFGSGQIPKFEGQYYKLAEENPENALYMIPTSEVVLNGLHMDEVLTEEQLPIRYAAYTPCFRREAGAAGAGERGLIRTHQFNKIEMFAFAHPEKSMELYDQMVSVAEEILQGLGLHYRLMLLVTGDMSFTAARTLDVEVYLPGQNRYYEVSSISNCTDFQARRSNIRFKNKQGKLDFVHTLNGSGLATSRLMVALLENFQNEEGSVTLPKVLQERLGVAQLKPTLSA